MGKRKREERGDTENGKKKSRRKREERDDVENDKQSDISESESVVEISTAGSLENSVEDNAETTTAIPQFTTKVTPTRSKIHSKCVFVVGRGKPKRKNVSLLIRKEAVLNMYNPSLRTMDPSTYYFPDGTMLGANRSNLYLATQVQKCILRHEWCAAMQFIKMMFTSPVNKLFRPFLLQSLAIILQMHPSSSQEQYREFMRLTGPLWKKGDKENIL